MIPNDRDIRKKEYEKLEKYQGLREELERMWKLKTKVVPLVIRSTWCYETKIQIPEARALSSTPSCARAGRWREASSSQYDCHRSGVRPQAAAIPVMCASARAGDSVRVTVRGGAPWGFHLQEEKEHHRPLLVSQVDRGGRASQAGLLEGDQVVSLNGEPAADLSPLDITSLLEAPVDCLELLVRRLHTQDGGCYWGKEKETWARGFELSRGSTSDRWKALSPTPDSGGSRPGILHGTSSTTRSLYIYSTRQELLGQGGHLVDSSSSSLGQVEVTVQHPQGGGELSICRTEAKGRVSPSKEGGKAEAPPASVSFGISAEGDAPAEHWDSESERDLGQPSKHRARHARFRRSESQSEKQLKEAKSKCRRIALLLTAASDPNNKGVLMFEKHRRRAKKFTLVSYGTGEEEHWSDEEEEEEQDHQAVRITFLATGKPQPTEDYFADVQGSCGIVISDLDIHQLAAEKKPDNQEEMEHLPETKGRGALMFAQRRQRVDEIAAAHEEMRSKGIPVEGPPGADNMGVISSHQVEERPYKLYGDSESAEVNLEIKQHQQHQEQQPAAQKYSSTMNGVPHQQPSEIQRSLVANRTAQPFSGVPNRVPAPFSPSRSITSPVIDQPGYSNSKFRIVPPPVITRPQVLSPTDQEQIVSRDERITVPAIKTGMLQDTKKRNTAKTAFSSNELFKVSSMSELLNAPKSDKKAGFEMGAEEDYLSLGAEACNFLQAPTVKHKTPPPVAPKPNINLTSPPWLTDNTTQAQNEIPSPAAGPPVASPKQTHPPQQHATLSMWSPPELHPPRQQPVSAWAPAQTKADLQLPGRAWGSSLQGTQAPAPGTTWAQQHAPVSTLSPASAAPHQPTSSWKQPYISAHSVASHLSQTAVSKARQPGSISSARAMSPASDMPTMRGRGAELFARRQSRMEKFVVDSETVQANKTRSQSPTPSLPSTWKYSPNVRAPPPSSYNPLLTPSYPLGAIKQHPASSVQTKLANKPKAKSATKHLNSLDVMKHQPYQMNASLFTYTPVVEAKAATLPSPTSQLMKPIGPGVSRSHSLSLPRRLSSMSSRVGFESPLTTPVFQPSFDPLERQTSWMEKTSKPSSPWGFQPEAAESQHGPPFRKYQSQSSVPENRPRYSSSGVDAQSPVSQPNYMSVCNASWKR
ncbi:synaptopodin-2-like [Arapaima gigas]